jgi:hypothetical protein
MQLSLAKLNKWAASFILLGIFIFLTGSCTPANHHPVIASLKAKQNVIAPLDSCVIECTASDPDGDELTYEWSASKGKITGAGATVAWSAPEAEGIYNIMVKVSDGNDGEANGSITIRVKANHPPTIISLIADADWVAPLSSCLIECVASDEDGDELSYEWSASGGGISGVGPVVTWAAPETVGLYDLAVTVNDGYDGESTRSLTISVAINPPPIIESLIVSSEEPKYLREYHDGYEIFKGKSCVIACIVSNASDELVYQWSCDDGEISGEGSVVKWTAPSGRDKVTVTVMVSELDGIPATESIVFEVETCTCAFR